MKFTRSRQELPILAVRRWNGHPPGSEIKKKELWVMLHPTTREMRNESRTVRLKTLPKIPFQKA